MVNFELIKIDSEFEKVLKEDQELKEIAAREFAKSEGIPVENALEMKGDWNLILGLNRFTIEYVGDFQKGNIPKTIISKRFKIKEINAEWTIVPNSNRENAFLYFFGGGYIMGSLNASSYIRYLLSKYTGVDVLGIDYSLAPETPFPAALDDAISSYEWLLSNGYDAQNIIIGGSSAGGGLAMATLLKAKEIGLKLPKAAVLISPWVDLTCRAKSIRKSREIEPELATGLKPMSSLYAKGENKKNPYISPVFGNLNKLPPLLIHAGSVEGLLDDAQLLANNAKSQNVEVKLKIWDNMPHDFQTYGDAHPTAKLAYEDICGFVQKHLNL